jgi:glycosyltransferase involved in cell wall biosynthesis
MYSASATLWSEYSLISFIKYLDTSRYRPIVVFNQESRVREILTGRGVLTAIVPHGRNGWGRGLLDYLCLPLRVFFLARRYSPSLIYADNIMAGRVGVVLKVLTGCPLIVQVRNCNLPPRTAFLLSFVDRFVAVSKVAGHAVLPVPRRKHLSVTYDGVDTSGYFSGEAISSIRDSALERLGLPKNVTIVGMAGRITPQKGQDVFVDAANLISRTYSDVAFVHIGGVPLPSNTSSYEFKLLAASRELCQNKKYFWLPYAEDMRVFWQAVDIAVCPSSGPEALGRVVLEAMAMGKPIVATRSGGPEELVEDGKSGLLVSMSDPPALARAIESLILNKEKRARLSGTALSIVRDRYSSEVYAGKLMAIFDEVSISGLAV